MRRILATALVSALFAAAATTAVLVGWSTARDGGSQPTGTLAVVQGETAEGDEPGPPPWAAAPGQDADRRGHDRLGPPPWAAAHGRDGAKADQGWKDRWRALSPAQKARKMEELARAHEEGMRTWTRCVRAAGADTAKRNACEKPLPPGLAKKQP